MSIKQGLVVVLIVLVAGWLGLRFWSGDERAIRKQMEILETSGSKEAAESSIKGLFKAKEIAELFNDPCQLTVESVGSMKEYSRKHIQDRILRVRASQDKASVSLHDIAIDVSEEANTALVHATIRLHGQRGEKVMANVHELRAEMGKIDGEWLFTSLTIVEVLER